MLADNFEVLSTESYSVSDDSLADSKGSVSLESVVMDQEEVSDTIRELILE